MSELTLLWSHHLLNRLAVAGGELRPAACAGPRSPGVLPERARSVTMVRNALERLVAKSRIERTKQKNTVLYTVAGSADDANDAAAQASLATGTAGAEETENTGKVSAQA